MKTNSKSLVFFGSGPVAAKSLELLAENFEIEAVVTKPKAVHHRGDVPVLKTAEKLNLKVFTVSNKKDLDDLMASSPFSSDLGVLIDFGIIISKKAIDYFDLGIVNSHFSILPEWRGADPITFAILSGQKITGVSLMLLVEAMDEGPLLAYGEFEMPDDITEPRLTQELINLSDALLVDTLPRYMSDQTDPFPQTVTGRRASYSRKISKEDGVIDWQKAAEQIDREIRAFISWPKSRATIAGQEVIVTQTRALKELGLPGNINIDLGRKEIIAGCGKGSLVIERLKPAGKQEMDAASFINGYIKKR